MAGPYRGNVPVVNPHLGFALIGAVAVTGWARADNWQTGVGGNAARHGLSEEIGPGAEDILWQGSLPAIVMHSLFLAAYSLRAPTAIDVTS